MTSKTKRIITRIALVFAGLIMSALLIEAGLYLVGYIHYQKSRKDLRTKKDFSPDTKVILCVGDSFTIGIGAPNGLDYPSQIEKIGREKGYDIAVINRGCSGQNTRMLLKELEASLIAVRPDIVTILSGGANQWNSAGITSLSTKGRIHNFLLNIRTVKLFRLLWINLHNNFKSPSIGLIEDTLILEQQDGWKIPHNFDWYAEILNIDTGSIDKDFFQKINQYCKQGEYEKAKQCIKQAGKIDDSEILQYNKFYKHTDNNRFDLAAQLVFDCFKNNSHWKLPELFVCEFLSSNKKDEALKDEDIADIIIASIKEYPTHRSSYNMAIQFMHGYTGKNSKQLKRKIAQALAQYSDYGNVFFEIAEQDGGQWVSKWIKQDLREIIRVCNSYGADVIVQNYPRFLEYCTPLFKSVADDSKAIFVNQAESFGQLPEQERPGYFAPDGHCNERGYKRMAENILNKLSDSGLIRKTIAQN